MLLLWRVFRVLSFCACFKKFEKSSTRFALIPRFFVARLICPDVFAGFHNDFVAAVLQNRQYTQRRNRRRKFEQRKL